SVKQRLQRPDQGISFTEFSYALLQSYDFAELNRRYGCRLQIGGNDQWGNWMKAINVIDFFRDVGKHFSINTMVNRDSVKQRLQRPDQGISFTEFSYALLQSYDFAELNRRYGCRLQIGGNDQWGN
ncbi:hypothetical protein REH77_29085, partial [Vibrio alginolyticus]